MTLISPLNVGVNNEPEDYMDPVNHIEGGAHLFKRQQVTPHVCCFIFSYMFYFIVSYIIDFESDIFLLAPYSQTKHFGGQELSLRVLFPNYLYSVILFY